MYRNTNNNGNDFKSLPLVEQKQRGTVDIALFIDNDEGYVRDVDGCGDRMYTLHVGGQEGKVSLLNWSSNSVKPFVKAVNKGYEGSKVLKSFQARTRGVSFDNQSGITKDHCDSIREWVTRIKKEGYRHPAVLFDYDRTLTVVEGTDLSLLDTTQFSMEGFLEYHIGGKERLAYLRELFKFLDEQGVSLYVLTNNGQCGVEPLFRTINEQLFRPYPVKILCGRDYRYKKRDAAADVLPSVCSGSIPVKNTTTYMNGEGENNLGEMTADQMNALIQKYQGKGGRSRRRRRLSKKRRQTKRK